MLVVFLLTIGFIHKSNGYGRGAPDTTCSSMMPLVSCRYLYYLFFFFRFSGLMMSFLSPCSMVQMLRHHLLHSPPRHFRWIHPTWLLIFNCLMDPLILTSMFYDHTHKGWCEPCLIHNLFMWIYICRQVWDLEELSLSDLQLLILETVSGDSSFTPPIQHHQL